MKINIYWQDATFTEIKNVNKDSDVVKCIRDGTIFDSIQVWPTISQTHAFNMKLAKRIMLTEDDDE